MVQMPHVFKSRVSQDKDLFNRNKDRFIEEAIQSVSVDIMPYLLANGCNCSDLLHDQSTYLHLACKRRKLPIEKQSGMLIIIKNLIENGCLFTFDQSGRTPLHYAAENKYEILCQYFISKYGIYTLEHRDFVNKSPIDFAQSKKNGNFLLSMKERILAEKDRKEKEFISKMPERELDDNDITTMIKRDYDKALKEFIKSDKLDVNQKLSNYQNTTLLHLCATCNSLNCLFVLITHGAETNIKDTNGYLPYQIAAKSNAVDVLISLIEINVEIKEKEEKQVLELIGKKNEAYHIFLYYFKFLITEGKFYKSMDVSIIERSKNIFNKLIFFDECISRPEAAKKIIYASAVNINAANLFGENAIYHIIRWSDETEEKHELIRLLVSKGCSINAQRRDGNTALHAVFIVKKYSFIKTLKECGCDDSIPNDNGTIVSKLTISQ
jgi:ankyrin repeat protein